MQKKLLIITFFVPVLIFSSCEKKQIKNKLDEYQGVWKISEMIYFQTYTIPGRGVAIPARDTLFDMNMVVDLQKDIHTIEFFQNNNPYTSTQKGVYKIDYANENLKDLIDTFSFMTTKKEFSITKKTTGDIVYSLLPRKPRLPQTALPLYRFKFDSPSGQQLLLDAGPYRLNETCYLKLNKQ
jgi:hypothetical protein